MCVKPFLALIFDAKGNLYGTTMLGGGQGVSTCSFFSADGCGTVFKPTPTNGITGNGGSANNFCTENDPEGCGTVFELSRASGGEYKETLIHSFSGVLDGGYPLSIILDASDNLYVAPYDGGVSDYGLVLEFSPVANGPWRTSFLYVFGNGRGGGWPLGLGFDSSGNVIGIAQIGGSKGDGAFFELSPPGDSR